MSSSDKPMAVLAAAVPFKKRHEARMYGFKFEDRRKIYIREIEEERVEAFKARCPFKFVRLK